MSALDVDRSALRSPHSNKRNSFPSPLTHAHIFEALHRSADNGATLNLSKLNLSDIGVSAAEQLATIGIRIGREAPEDKSPVERIALGNNRLTTLPTEFALLSCLRYLNLKHNSFSVFPDVLTLMPLLDTLDISHNKIKRLPSQPGYLVHLRVFCFSRNKVTKLPTYLSQFHRLDVLHLDRNPVEWPPRTVVERPSNLESEEDIKDWIRNLQRWMEAEVSRTKMHDDSGFSEQHEPEHNTEESYDSWRFPIHKSEFDAGVTPHARSFSLDSNFSMSSIPESLKDIEISTHGQAERPPPLHLGILQSYSTETSPTRSLESYLPSPADSDTFDDNINPEPTHNGYLESQSHARGASYAGGLHSENHAELLEKKSMPDLRTAKLNFGRKIPGLPHAGFPIMTTNKTKNLDDSSIPSPLSQRQDSGSSIGSTSRIAKPFSREPTHVSPTRAAPSMAFERNSYFRRLSTLPTSITLPKPLVCLVDSARSILFAVCQVYQTLEHYTVYAIDDRLASVLKKVLDPASADMMQLINALDRFDAMSRKTLPPPPVCRGVIESCKDTVAAFGKAVGVLSLQLKVIATCDDVRYSRWLLLELYAATAEISCAWQAMIPQIDSIKPLLHAKPFASQSPPVTLPESFPDQPASLPAFRPHLGPGPIATPVGVGRPRTARRHAGSFSSKDVEIGKKLPSYDDVPSMLGGIIPGVATHTHTLRAPKRQGTVHLSATTVTVSSPSPTNHIPGTSNSGLLLSEGLYSNHSRQGSQTSLQASSTSSSPSVPAKTTFLELPSSSKTQVDKEALHAVQEAVEVAPIVWDMMEEMLGDVHEAQVEVRESLERARIITKKLSEVIRAMREAGPAADRRVLREDAHMFLKSVVQLSNIIKTLGGNVSPTLRTNMVKLTNSTEEFAILLHVSSFSPLQLRSYSPMFGPSAVQGSPPGTPDEARLTSSLSRSRSAQPSGSFKISALTTHGGPRSALPSQSFNVPIIRRLRGRETRADTADPG